MKIIFHHRRNKNTIVGFVVSVLMTTLIINYCFAKTPKQGTFWLFFQSTIILLSGYLWLKYRMEPLLKEAKGMQKVNQEKENEMRQLKNELSELAFEVYASEEKLKMQAEKLNKKESEVNQIQRFTNTALYIRQYLSQKDILRVILEEIQDLLSVERVAICCFNNDCSGTILMERATNGFPKIPNKEIEDLCFSKQRKQQYKNGHVSAIDDIYKAELSECYVTFLEGIGVRASLVVPIPQGKHLFGLLIAHKCREPRVWQEWETNLVKQLAIQVGIALSKAEQFEQSENARSKAESLVQEQRQQNQKLQEQITTLENREDTEPKSEIKQAEALSALSQISFSIQAVADSIQQAVTMTRDIRAAAEAGTTIMEQTFESILNLRSTVVEADYKVKHFGETLQEILKVVSSINQTAMQTNVLALNSSFDANKTEENGRGFTIVAGEVGKLATQSSKASEEIKQIVENIQIQNQEVMEAIEKGMIQVTEEAELIKNTRYNLKQIGEFSHQLHELVQSIISTTLYQTETFQSVMDLLQN